MAHTTTDHDTIRKWIEQRGGVPATVESTAPGDEVGILRVDFPHGGRDDELSTVAWEDFFAKFDKEKLAFLYEEKTGDGEMSRFCKFVRREK